MRAGRVHVLALVVGGCLVLGASSAGAGTPPVHCGSVLVRSTTLTADLLQCAGTGLVIGADGITVNLAGHTISGTNAAGSEGIADDGHAGVRILGGRISDFRLNGVGIRGAQGSVVRGLTIRRIGAGGLEGEPVSAGIAISDAPGSQIIGNDVANDVLAYQSDGADVIGSAGAVVQGNRLSHNSWNGLALFESAGSRVLGNELDANGNNGTEVNGGSDSTWVVANHADQNTSAGIVLGSASGARIVGNSATGNDTRFFFFDLHDSLISLNSASGNGDGLDLAGGQFGSDGNRVFGNVASHNDAAGITVFEGAKLNIVAGNVANANVDSGIVVSEGEPGDTAGNSLTSNTANKNQNHGIDAVAGTVDGGGNRASGNAVAPQCLNVICAG
jgi:large repetitive protein